MLKEFENQVKAADGQISGITAADLMEKKFPELRWVIKGILPEGANLLAGKPKKGKSLLVSNFSLGTTATGLVLGTISVEKGAVIYLALEDTERRLQSRIRQMLDGEKAPANLHLFTKWPRMDAGGLDLLEAKIKEIPDVRLVIIDTLQKFRKPAKSNGHLYSDDYEVVAAIKEVADRLGVCILMVHHLRKAVADDVFDTLSGSLGLTGGVDGILVLENNKGMTTLHVTGRDVEEAEYALDLDRQTLTWRLLGARSEVKATREQQLIYDTLKQASEPLSPKEIAETTGVKVGTVKSILGRFADDQSVERTSYGRYSIKEII